MNPILNGIAGNWEMAGMLTLRSGFHLEVDSWADPSGTGGFATRPNLTGPVRYIKQQVNYNPRCPSPDCPVPPVPGIQWFDPSVLVMPWATGTFGNEGIGAIVGPPLKTFDFSLHKSFPFGENKRFEFRAEAMNLRIRRFCCSARGRPSLTVSPIRWREQPEKSTSPPTRANFSFH